MMAAMRMYGKSPSNILISRTSEQFSMGVDVAFEHASYQICSDHDILYDKVKLVS